MPERLVLSWIPTRRAITSGLVVLTAALAIVVVAARQSSRDETREEWQKVPEIVQALGIRSGSSVADVGAGGGFFTLRLAEVVGSAGRVYAVDVAEDDLRRLRERTTNAGLRQVEVIAGARDNPRLPDGAIDAVLIVNAYHEMSEHQAMLRAIRRALKPDGDLVIVEPIVESRRGGSRARQERSHEIEPKYVEGDLRDAGFDILELRDPFTRRPAGDTEWLIVATPTFVFER
ncbi:MAG: class I SAM-dependent methyltransferase [Vicinamibacterales bacterium]